MKEIPARLLVQAVLLGMACLPGAIAWILLQFQPLSFWTSYPWSFAVVFPLSALQIAFLIVFLFGSVHCWHPRTKMT